MRNRNDERKRQIHNKKQRVFSYLCEHSCVECGENDPLVLEFDHLFDKRSDISSLIQSACSWSVLKKELIKCQVLCSNCHKRKTHRESNSYRYQFMQLGQTG